MERTDRFDDIRPYYEEEIPAAMERIAANGAFPLISSYVYPDRDVEQVREMVRSFSTVDEFQKIVMYKVNEEIIRKTVTEFSCDGFSKLEKGKRFLFVSNHRDIMLDASLLQNALLDHGFETSEITFGANLMSNQLVIDIGKSNKMFRVERGGNAREFYLSSVHLSDYIRYAITRKKQSVWIAQRNGRTKDGNDATDQGIIKMFGMSRSDDKVDSLAELNIVPVSISYEWEPCDVLKVLELYETSQRAYVKKPGEDLNSILQGILEPKGKVHIQICDPITRNELEAFGDFTSSRFHREVAALLDKRICSGYALSPNNWIAHDLRYGQSNYKNKYTAEQKTAFIDHICQLEKYETYNLDAMREIMLGIYANPVDNWLKYKD